MRNHSIEKVKDFCLEYFNDDRIQVAIKLKKKKRVSGREKKKKECKLKAKKKKKKESENRVAKYENKILKN